MNEQERPTQGAGEGQAGPAVGKKSKMADLKLRLVSAIVLGPLVLVLVWLGGGAYTALIAVAGVLFFWEWLRITGVSDRGPTAVIGYLAILLAIASFASQRELLALGCVLVGVAAAGLSAHLAPRSEGRGLWTAAGVAYTGLCMLALLALRHAEQGLVFIIYLLVVVWGTDVFAYFVGRFVGGPKLWRRVSPNKTWSGALGGMGFAVLFSGLFIHFAGQGNPFLWMVLAAFLSAASQAGDLMESAMKRRFDVKDSSRLIPGHGGVMDRIDGLVAAGLAAALIGLLAGGSLANPLAGLGVF